MARPPADERTSFDVLDGQAADTGGEAMDFVAPSLNRIAVAGGPRQYSTYCSAESRSGVAGGGGRTGDGNKDTTVGSGTAASGPCLVTSALPSDDCLVSDKKRIDQDLSVVIAKRKPNQAERARKRGKGEHGVSVPSNKERTIEFMDVFNIAGSLHEALCLASPQFLYEHDIGMRFDLTERSIFDEIKKEIKNKHIRWLHLMVPTPTFRSNHHERFRSRSNVDHLLDFGDPDNFHREIDEANLLLRRACSLIRLQLKAGGFVSLVHPSCSSLWNTPTVLEVSSYPTIRSFTGDQCIGGLAHKRSTR